jgi:transcriptional regulator with XRE-family HTH domain
MDENLRTARIRRRMTIADVAERIGTGPRAVMDAEKGKASTGIVVYAGLLWLYDLLAPLEEVADPLKVCSTYPRVPPVSSRSPRVGRVWAKIGCHQASHLPGTEETRRRRDVPSARCSD